MVFKYMKVRVNNMFNYKRVAKKFIFLFIIAALQTFNVWADGNGSEAYFNYYRRNNDGTFVLGHIDAAEAGVDLFSYKASSEGNVINAVTGYYYKSDAVKFVDTINNNKIVQTEYFDRFNKTVCTRINTYRIDGFMESVTITEFRGEDSTDEANKIWMFFEKDPFSRNYMYYAVRVWENVSPSDTLDIPNIPTKGYVPSGYMVSEGRVNGNYQPVVVTSKLFTRKEKDLSSSIITEMYMYDATGSMGEYTAFVNHRLYMTAARVVINDKTVKHVKDYYDIWGLRPAHNFLAMQQGEYEAQYQFEGDDFDENETPHIKRKIYIKEDLYIDRYVKQDTYEETGEFVIFCSDEQVSFKPGMEAPVSALNLSFDIFSDNTLFMHRYTRYFRNYGRQYLLLPNDSDP